MDRFDIKLSVRLMCYNHGLYIEQALHGIDIQKTNFDFELVIGDDFSEDDTLKKIKAYKFSNPRLKVKILNRIKGDDYDFERQKKGRLYNFVDTLNNCSGEFIALLDGDDFWVDETKLQRQVSQLESNPSATLSFHKVKVLKKNGDLLEDFITKVPDVFDDVYALGLKGNYIHTPTVVFRNVICLPDDFVKVPYGDYFLYMLLAEQGKLMYIKEEMAVYRYQVGLLSKKSNTNMIKDAVRLYSYMIANFTEPALIDILIKKQEGVVMHYVNLLKTSKKTYLSRIPKLSLLKSKFLKVKKIPKN